MPELDLGSLTEVDPHDLWTNETQDFTPWLADHVDLLSEALGLDLEIEQREAAVGSFAVDLLGTERETGKVVIIENQLEETDHRHLGQLLTYASGLDAGIIIWVSPRFRDEHREAVHWLNAQTGEGVAFFGAELELLRIDESRPAPRFNVVAEPSEFQRALKESVAKPSERGLAYQRFFRRLVDCLHDEHPGLVYTQAESVGYHSSILFGAGRLGFQLLVSFVSGRKFRIALVITTGDKDRNKRAFDQLHSQREVMAAALGEEPAWERLDENVTSRVAVYRDGDIELSPQDRLDELLRWSVDFLPVFRSTFEGRLGSLNLDVPEPATGDSSAPPPA